MANSLYALGREAFLEGSIAALTDTIDAGLWSTSYTPNLSTDEFFTSVSSSFSVGGAVIAAGVALTSVTGSAGTLSAANTTFSSVSGSPASYVGLYKNTGTPSTSRLIGLIDTATGLPVTPNGGNITVAWASGAIFTLFESLSESERDWRVVQRLKELLRWLKANRPKAGELWIPEPKIVLG
jgi:hypothetical protein